MAISDKLQELLVIKQDIKEAIENKGVDMTDVEFRGYAEKINQIETGGGASLDRIGIICFSPDLKKTSSTATLTYDINSEMLSKTFFTDGKGNWYLPEDVGVYYGDTYKGKANTTLTLFSGSGTVTGDVSFRVGTTPVALLLYYYADDFTGRGINTHGYLTIKWSSGSGEVFPDKYHMEFIELPDNFFDDFPYYTHSLVDYWKKANFFPIPFLGRTSLNIGWELIDAD